MAVFAWLPDHQVIVADGLQDSKGRPTEFAAGCVDCDVYTDQYATREEAIAAWNDRPTIERLLVELKRALQGLEQQPIARVRNRLSRHRESGTLRTEILIYDKDVEALLKAADALSNLTLGGSSA